MAKKKKDKRQLRLELVSVAELKEAQAEEAKAEADLPRYCGFCTDHVPATQALSNKHLRAEVCDRCASWMKKQGWAE